MKSYLSLISISARVRKKQCKMIVLCIVLSVFLVTAIFSLVDAVVRMETENAIDKGGYWHINIGGIRTEEAARIAARPDVAVSSWYDVVNFDKDLTMSEAYYIQDAQTALCGIEPSFIGDIMHYFDENAQVTDENVVVLTENAQELLGIRTGDTITLNTPAGDYVFTVSGFRISGNGKYVSSSGGETSALLVKENQVGAFLNMNMFRRICEENGEAGAPRYYIRFGKHTNLRKALAQIKAEYGLDDDDIEYHTILMASNGITNQNYIKNVYPIAGLLFLLILAAGVLMISGSMNSNVAQRMQFFGMLRCIGASKSQIIRFVRLEALNWCKTAVPIGLAFGVLVTWCVNAGLKYLVGGETSNISVFIISPVGIVFGVVIGVVTVFFAAQAPAKRAAKVSPAAAVSGNAQDTNQVRRAVNLHLGKVETVLGIHHAVSARKNLLLLTGSFAISIVLFLCFSVLVTFINCLLPQKASAPDLDIGSADYTNTIEASLLDEIREIDGVKHVFGRRFRNDVSAVIGNTQYTIELMSYDAYQLGLLAKDHDLRKGSNLRKMYEDSHNVLVIWDRGMPLEVGDKMEVLGETLEIVGMLKYSPFSNDGSNDGKITLITTEELFTNLTGITDYAVIDVQMAGRSTNENNEAVAQIRRMSSAYVFRDRREESVAGVYYAFLTFVYGFLAIIALIVLLNIMNSISMSVSARMNQYGAMRAIGMSARQIGKMVAAETFTYVGFGCVTGCAVGLPLSKYMFDFLITAHFFYASWSVPVAQIVVVVLFMLVSSAAAVYAPLRRIREMEIAETINEL